MHSFPLLFKLIVFHSNAFHSCCAYFEIYIFIMHNISLCILCILHTIMHHILSIHTLLKHFTFFVSCYYRRTDRPTDRPTLPGIELLSQLKTWAVPLWFSFLFFLWGLDFFTVLYCNLAGLLVGDMSKLCHKLFLGA